MSTSLDMTTLTEVLERLRVKKHDNEFIFKDNVFNAPSGKTYQPEELTIIKTFRFEGESDPGSSSILYVFEANDGMIGYSIDAFGAYTNHDEEGYDDFIRKIAVKDRDEQQIFE